ncbi:unnamed protein product [marine sediment metagenome]|uniref:DNA polymerase beta thumb domain-containing protein n=1 Tax=marine sediment metagenome TaxID=412755 RepID=X1Q6K3_9ZZZZ
MKLGEAKKIADGLVERFKLFCKKIEVAGSIRRRCHWVNDIDIVMVPWDATGIQNLVLRLGRRRLMGSKLIRFDYDGIQVDLYLTNEKSWATLLLIRTGSKKNNIRLCSLARRRGWHLAAGGRGLFNERGERIAGDSERSIYEALELEYQEPWERR